MEITVQLPAKLTYKAHHPPPLSIILQYLHHCSFKNKNPKGRLQTVLSPFQPVVFFVLQGGKKTVSLACFDS